MTLPMPTVQESIAAAAENQAAKTITDMDELKQKMQEINEQGGILVTPPGFEIEPQPKYTPAFYGDSPADADDSNDDDFVEKVKSRVRRDPQRRKQTPTPDPDELIRGALDVLNSLQSDFNANASIMENFFPTGEDGDLLPHAYAALSPAEYGIYQIRKELDQVCDTIRTGKKVKNERQLSYECGYRDQLSAVLSYVQNDVVDVRRQTEQDVDEFIRRETEIIERRLQESGMPGNRMDFLDYATVTGKAAALEMAGNALAEDWNGTDSYRDHLAEFETWGKVEKADWLQRRCREVVQVRNLRRVRDGTGPAFPFHKTALDDSARPAGKSRTDMTDAELLNDALEALRLLQLRGGDPARRSVVAAAEGMLAEQQNAISQDESELAEMLDFAKRINHSFDERLRFNRGAERHGQQANVERIGAIVARAFGHDSGDVINLLQLHLANDSHGGLHLDTVNVAEDRTQVEETARIIATAYGEEQEAVLSELRANLDGGEFAPVTREPAAAPVQAVNTSALSAEELLKYNLVRWMIDAAMHLSKPDETVDRGRHDRNIVMMAEQVRGKFGGTLAETIRFVEDAAHRMPVAVFRPVPADLADIEDEIDTGKSTGDEEITMEEAGRKRNLVLQMAVKGSDATKAVHNKNLTAVAKAVVAEFGGTVASAKRFVKSIIGRDNHSMIVAVNEVDPATVQPAEEVAEPEKVDGAAAEQQNAVITTEKPAEEAG